MQLCKENIISNVFVYARLNAAAKYCEGVGFKNLYYGAAYVPLGLDRDMQREMKQIDIKVVWENCGKNPLELIHYG